MKFSEKYRVAVLDDYQGAALKFADWGVLAERADVTVFGDHLFDVGAIVKRLEPFDIVCVMRERTPLTRAIIERLPNLKLICSTGPGNASIDKEAATERHIKVANTGYTSTPTIELTWALILASARNIVTENNEVACGGWQQSVGDDLAGKTLGVVGLGHIGSAVAKIGLAFGMHVIAWSEHLTAERCAEVGCALVSKEMLFKQADIVTIHLVLSERTRGLISDNELVLMKTSARLINTSRGPIVVEKDLIAALENEEIAGAAIDVFDQEPLPVDHFFRTAPNVLATPHIGYVTKETYLRFYGDTVSNIKEWIGEQK